MANAENLKGYEFGKTGKRTVSEQREIQSQGGIASGASRRAYRGLKQAARCFFKENENASMAIIQALYEAAIDGDVRAVEKLEDLVGETVQREELALKKKLAKAGEKTDNGRMAELLEGLQNDDLHEEAAGADGTVEEA